MVSSKTPIPGVLYVNSDTISPALSREDFEEWYTKEHIPDVVAISGVASAARYNFIPSPHAPERELKFLTLYQMPDLNFMDSAEFRGLEGQSEGPSKERIFKKAVFDTRGYRAVQTDQAPKDSSGK